MPRVAPSYNFVQVFECQTLVFDSVSVAPCTSGVASHVFDPTISTLGRYGLYVTSVFAEVVYLVKPLVIVAIMQGILISTFCLND